MISNKSHYKILVDIISKYGPNTSLEDRKKFAYLGFKLTTQYDSSISQYLFPDTEKELDMVKILIKKDGLWEI